MNDCQTLQKYRQHHMGQMVVDMLFCPPMTNDTWATLAHRRTLTTPHFQEKPAVERFNQKLKAHFLEQA